jgi:hypothetical protein
MTNSENVNSAIGARHSVSALTIMLALLVMGLATASAQPAVEVSKQVEQAVLAENWAKVTELLKDVDTLTESPVLRLLKGHACLATNQNNKSVCMFLDVMTEESTLVQRHLKEWQQWTQGLATGNSENAIAHYLVGDASARLQDWDGALNEFNKAIALAPGHPLALNARGVVSAATGKFRAARADLDAASQNPASPLADVYANIGALRIQQRNGADGAKRAYDQCLAVTPDFVLALHGRGCVMLVLDSLDRTSSDFKKAGDNAPCAMVSLMMGRNWMRMAAYCEGMTEAELVASLSDSSRKAGMALNANVQRDKAIMPGLVTSLGNLQHQYKEGGMFFGDRRLYKAMMDKYTQLSPEGKQSFRENHLEPLIKRDCNFAEKFARSTATSQATQKFGAVVLPNLAEDLKFAGKLAAGYGLAASRTVVGAKVGLPVTAAGIGAFAAGQITQNYHDLVNTKRLGATEDFMGSVEKSSGPCAGVDMSWAATHWDDGDWPFLPYYGLMYTVNTEQLPNRSQE